jgi:peptide chain release factor 1
MLSGIVASCGGTSQHKNKAKALMMLRAKLMMLKRQNVILRAAERRGQVGSGDRSERIRPAISGGVTITASTYRHKLADH